MSIERADIEKLAKLARIAIPDAEVADIQKDLNAIFAYISQIQEAVDSSVSVPDVATGAVNIFRDDRDAHEPGAFTDFIIAQAPRHDAKYVQVRKILDK